MEPRAIAILEEVRQAQAVAESSLESVRIGGGWACWSEPGSWQNQAMGLGLDGPVGESALDALVAYYADRRAPVRVEVCPYAHGSLVSGLHARGFAVRAFETVLHRALDGSVDPCWPDGVTVREVSTDDEADLRRFVDTFAAGFAAAADESTDPEPALRAALRVARHPRVSSFVVEVEGVPAAGACLERAPPLARLIGASVLPDFRRRGIQTALVQLRVHSGWLAGCDHATIQSRPGASTERNALRLGFRVACTKVTMDLRDAFGADVG